MSRPNNTAGIRYSVLGVGACAGVPRRVRRSAYLRAAASPDWWAQITPDGGGDHGVPTIW